MTFFLAAGLLILAAIGSAIVGTLVCAWMAYHCTALLKLHRRVICGAFIWLSLLFCGIAALDLAFDLEVLK